MGPVFGLLLARGAGGRTEWGEARVCTASPASLGAAGPQAADALHRDSALERGGGGARSNVANARSGSGGRRAGPPRPCYTVPGFERSGRGGSPAG